MRKRVPEQRKILLKHQETENSLSFTSTNRITQAPPDTTAATTQATQDTTDHRLTTTHAETITTKLAKMLPSIYEYIDHWPRKALTLPAEQS